MSLEKWVEYGWLRREATSPGEIKDLLGIADRGLADSKVEAVSTDLRFIAAFSAALTVATTLGTARRSDFPAEWLRTNNHAAERTPAVEMAGRGNRENVQTRPFPDSPHPWKSRTKRGIPTFPPRRRRRTDFTPDSEKPPKSRSSTDSRSEPINHSLDPSV
jgi:hypothetical protein